MTNRIEVFMCTKCTLQPLSINDTHVIIHLQITLKAYSTDLFTLYSMTNPTKKLTCHSQLINEKPCRKNEYSANFCFHLNVFFLFFNMRVSYEYYNFYYHDDATRNNKLCFFFSQCFSPSTSINVIYFTCFQLIRASNAQI